MRTSSYKWATQVVESFGTCIVDSALVAAYTLKQDPLLQVRTLAWISSGTTIPDAAALISRGFPLEISSSAIS